MVSLLLPTSVHVAERIAEGGAILTLPGVPLIRHLVGDFRWIAPNELCWSSVDENGAAPRLHCLFFESLSVHAFGVCFHRKDGIVAALTPIEQAALDQPALYRQAWQIWRMRPESNPAAIGERGANAAAELCRARSEPVQTLPASL